MEEADRARETDHATAHEAAAVARMAKRPPAGAHPLRAPATRATRRSLLDEAQAIFPETVVARDGLAIDIAYQD